MAICSKVGYFRKTGSGIREINQNQNREQGAVIWNSHNTIFTGYTFPLRAAIMRAMRPIVVDQYNAA